MKRIIILGAGGHGKEVAWTLRCMREVGAAVELLGYCDDFVAKGTIVAGIPVLGSIESAADSVSGPVAYICAVGLNKVRPSLVARAEASGWVPFTVIHPSAVIAERAEIQPGSYVATGSYVGPDAVVGSHAIVNFQSSIGHDAVLESFVQLCPGVRISGGAKIGGGCFFGSNSVVAPGVSVGAETTVCAASFVGKSVPPRVFILGVPGRVTPQPE